MAYDSCDISRDKHMALKLLALLQAATLATMLVYFLRIQKTYTDFPAQQQVCASKASVDKFLQFEKNYKIAFWTNLASFILNLIFLASYPHLPYRAALLANCFLLFVGGVLCMSFSAEGFKVIQNDLRNEPPECKHFFKDLKNLFLTGLVVGTGQTLLAGVSGWRAYSSGGSSSFYRR